MDIVIHVLFSSDEWMPDILVPLAFDRASQAKVIILKFMQGLIDPTEDLSEAYMQIKKIF